MWAPPHLYPFRQVCSQPQRLELAPVLETRRAGPFVEDLHCLEFRYVDYCWTTLTEVTQAIETEAATREGVYSEDSAIEGGCWMSHAGPLRHWSLE